MAIVLDGTSGITTPALDSVARFATADMPLGSVIQVVYADYGTETSNSTSTFADTGLTATITPTSATSKILVLFSQNGVLKALNNTALLLKLLRDGSVIFNIHDIAASTNDTSLNSVGAIAGTYLDAPATTSAVTYKTQFASRANTDAVYVQAYGSNLGFTRSSLTLMEIAA
jgi:hypothetical protein